jgi:HD-like signal output (HDOD) protein
MSGPGAKAGAQLLAQAKGSPPQSGKGSPPGSEGEQRVEDVVLGLDAFKSIEVPKIFSDFLTDVAPRLTLAATSHAVLKNFSNPDVTAEKVAASLKSNPYYQLHFIKMIESMGKREELPSLEGGIILLGMQNTRDLILGLQMHRSVTGQHPAYTKEGKLQTSPKDLMKYALKTEESLSAQKLPHSDLGYAAGMLFDFLTLLCAELAGGSKEILAYIDQAYLHGNRTGMIAREIARGVPDFPLSKFVYSASLIHDVGKAVMAILEPKYLDYLEAIQGKEIPRAARLFAETRRFGVNHALIGGMVCQTFQVFRQIEPVILFHHDPYLLKQRHRNLHPLGAIVCLATNMAGNFKKIDKLDDPQISLWKGPELADWRLEGRVMLNAVAKVNF